MKNIENIDDLLLDSESFHVKDRSKAARRKKAYFKGKKRFDRAYNTGFTPFPKAESIIRGMFRKTNVVKVFYEKDYTKFGASHGTVKRLETVKDKFAEYAMEVA